MEPAADLAALLAFGLLSVLDAAVAAFLPVFSVFDILYSSNLVQITAGRIDRSDILSYMK